MVLMPCGRCCCLASEPFSALGNPTSVEVDLVQGTDHNYSLSGTVDASSYYKWDLTASARLKPLTGTYSLSLTSVNHWEYEDSDVWITFDLASGSTPSQSITIVPKVSCTATSVNYYGSSSKDSIGGVGASIVRDCDSSSKNRFTSTSFQRYKLTYSNFGAWYAGPIGDVVSLDGIANAFAGLGNDSSNNGTWRMNAVYMEKGRTGSFPFGCSLPFVATSRVGVSVQRSWSQTWSQSASSFPLTLSPTPVVLNDYFVFYYFEYEITVSACRLVYSSQTIDHMSTAAAVCEGFSWV